MVVGLRGSDLRSLVCDTVSDPCVTWFCKEQAYDSELFQYALTRWFHVCAGGDTPADEPATPKLSNRATSFLLRGPRVVINRVTSRTAVVSMTVVNGVISRTVVI